MKIKGLIELEIPLEEENEFCTENGLTEKDDVLSYLLKDAEIFLGNEEVKIEVTNVSWIEEPSSEAFEDEEETEDDEDYNKTDV